MEKFKKLLTFLLFPHNAIVIIVTLIACTMLILTFTAGNEQTVFAYASYFLSAYSLTVICTKMPTFIKSAKNFKENNKYIKRYLEDINFRFKSSMYFSIIMNTFFVVLQLGSGIYYKSLWFYSLAIYYALLLFMRLILTVGMRGLTPGQDYFGELLRYRFCGIVLLLINQALIGITFFIVKQNQGSSYNEILTIAVAAYSFFTVTVAIVNIIKYKRFGSPMMSAIKAVNLATALVSMLSLETAMLSAFGDESDPTFRTIMTSCTSFVICLFILAMAIYMIIKSTKKIKELKNERKQ